MQQTSLLHINTESIQQIDILNPIQPGDVIDEKSCILDVKLLFNNNQIINIEMQVSREGDWVERSLVYLCRIVSQQLKPGEAYGNLMETIHIGILDFTLFEEHQEFYSRYLLKDERTGHIYTGKFALAVVELNQIGKATEDDINSGLRDWAKLFKARTWEEIKMLAQQNECMKSAAVTLKELTAEEKIQEQCEARERYERDRVSLFYEGKKEGIKEGIEKGRQLEKARADAAEAKIKTLEAALEALKNN